MGEFMKQKLSFILLLTITIIWGGAFVFQNLASQYVSSFTFNFLRFFIASIALLPLSIVSYRKDVKNGNKINAKQLIIGSVLCGGFLSLASILQQYGIQYTSVGKAGFIPLISLIFKKRYGINVYIAVFLSLIGLYLLCVNDSFTFEKGDLFLLGCALCFAIQIMIIEYFAIFSTFPELPGLRRTFVVGENAAYKGSIYFDDAALVVDGNVLLSNDFESGKVNACTYTMNQSEKENTPKVVGFTGKALDVAKKTLTIKAGKKATIKAATMPNSKVTYKTSNKKVATVTNKGVVKGVKKGKAVITVKANGKTVKVKITVK